ncbi:MAG: response regulator [Chrysiogenetes bacterium]|nr:response regulator [Chrysiogenetes bacterium]
MADHLLEKPPYPLSERLRWYLRGLIEAGETQKTVLILGLTLPFCVFYILRIHYLMDHPGVEAYLNRSMLALTGTVVKLATLWALVLTTWGALLWRAGRSSRLHLHLTLQSWSVAVSLVAYAVGMFTSPVAVAFIAGALLGFLLFEVRVIWYAIWTGTAITVATIVAERLGYLPYAPLLASFDRFGGTPSNSWILGSAVSSISMLFIAYGVSSYIISRWREREAQAIEALRSVERLANAVDHAGEIVVTTDARGVIEYVNPAYEAVTGYEAGESIGRTPLEIFGSPPEGDALLETGLGQARENESWSGRVALRKKNGSKADVDYTISCVLGRDCEVESYVAIARDVTEQLLLEAQFRQAQKMEALGQLVGGIAHDFNNQLTMVALAIELLGHETNLSAEGQEALDSLSECNEEAAGLTSQLLTFSRKQIDAPDPVDLVAVTQRATTALRRLLGERYTVRLNLAVPDGYVAASPAQLLQILFNLCVNARDAMLDGGVVEVSVYEAEVREPIVHPDATVQAGEYLVLQVRDEGAGIPPAILSRIYEPFFTTKRSRGTGLGLATVYGIVTQAGGTILCESAEGRGTTFRLYFPRLEARPPQSVAPQTKSTPEMPGMHQTVLVAEDEGRLLQGARRVLERAGYHVLTAEGVSEALEICEDYEGEIDLLFTDVIMADGSGSQLAHLFGKARPDVPVVYTSGYVDDATARRGIAGGKIEFLAKPYTADQLLQTMAKVLQPEKNARPPA